MSVPEVSVVMSVYNGAKYLRESVESILSQEGVDFEFIIVNDGSTDDSGNILAEYAKKDSRIRIIGQENAGLTRALVRGCKEANGKCIARQDAGDISLPGRLRRQFDIFEKCSEAVLVSCGTRFVGPEGEHLYDVIQNDRDAAEGLRALSPNLIQGPSHHGSTMFLRAAYEKAGGYRPEFFFAQDLDLWVRLIETGSHVTIPEPLYLARVVPFDISRNYGKEQTKLTGYLLDCKRMRSAGLSEESILSKAAKIRPIPNGKSSRFLKAKGVYFIGACLMKTDYAQAQKYFKQAIKLDPFHVRSWVRLLFGHMSI